MFKKLLEPLQKSYALEIKVKGEIDWNSIWKFVDSASAPGSFGRFAKIAMDIPDYIGEFVVYKNNEIRRGYTDGLEKKTAFLDINNLSTIKEIARNGIVQASFGEENFIKYNKEKIVDEKEIEKERQKMRDKFPQYDEFNDYIR